jgi:hypothetical protein
MSMTGSAVIRRYRMIALLLFHARRAAILHSIAPLPAMQTLTTERLLVSLGKQSHLRHPSNLVFSLHTATMPLPVPDLVYQALMSGLGIIHTRPTSASDFMGDRSSWPLPCFDDLISKRHLSGMAHSLHRKSMVSLHRSFWEAL